jgi:hypothetical protein
LAKSIKLLITTRAIRPIKTITFQKLLRFQMSVIDSALCNIEFHKADGIINNISINDKAKLRTPQNLYHNIVGKKMDNKISTIKV